MRRKKSKLAIAGQVTLLLVGFSLLTLSAGTVYAGYRLSKNVSRVEAITESELLQSGHSEIYAADNETLLWTNAKYQHRHLSLDDTPQVLIDLLTSTEDKTFFENDGYDLKAILNAAIGRLLRRPNARGGSTIKQQLVKNTRYLGVTIDLEDRKMQELALAKRLSDDFSDEFLLEAYLNKVGFLESAYGFRTAMYLLYGKDITKDQVDSLSVAQYAMLVAMLKNPSIYNPRSNPEGSLARRNLVLKTAYEDGKISRPVYEEARRYKIDEGLKSQGWLTQQVYEVATEHGAYVNSILTQLEEYGYDVTDTDNPIRVTSHLDLVKNKWLQDEVSKPEYYGNDDQQIAVTVMEPSTGVVLAQVGSRHKAAATDLNRAVQKTRSSGSTIKPFLDYGPAIEYGNVTENTIWPANTTVYPGTNVVVRNYGNREYGNVTTQQALKLSLNVPAVLALQNQNPAWSIKMMRAIGLNHYLFDEDGLLRPKGHYGGSDALGVNDSTQSFAAAYATLANGGVYKKPMYIKSISAKGRDVLFENKGHQAMSPRTAYKLLKMLKTTTESDGSAAAATIPDYKGYAVKTGTVGFDANMTIYSDKEHSSVVGPAGRVVANLAATDIWLSGTTKSVAVSIWSGFDDPAVYGNWVTAEQSMRADIFKNVMTYFNDGKDTSDWAATEERREVADLRGQRETASVDTAAISQIINGGISIQGVTGSDITVSDAERTFYDQYMNNVLEEPYLKAKPYYEASNPHGYALDVSGRSAARRYTINSSGQFIPEP